jgi:hypothetical protein
MRLQISLRRAIGASAALVMLTTAFPTHAETFGRTSIGANPSGGLRADHKRGSKFTLSEVATLKSLCAYVDGNGGGTVNWGYQLFRIELFKDVNGVPGERVAGTDDLQILPGQNGEWKCGGASLTPLTPGDYWIALFTGGDHALGRYYADGVGNWYGNVDIWGSRNQLETFGPGSFGDGTLSVYAEYWPLSKLSRAGKVTVGSQVANLTAGGSNKRATRFTMPETGRIVGMNAFTDGYANGIEYQDLRYNIYTDNNGQPGEIIPHLNATTGVEDHWHSQWRSGYMWELNTLPAGNYWFSIQGGQGGTARYRFDPSGSLFSSSDWYDDGPSASFGTGQQSVGTISAFVAYEPGPFVIEKVGRSDVASTVLSPMSANQLRGSYFTAPKPNGILKNAYVYLDGLGGTSGEQKMKFIVYDVAMQVVAFGSEVTIPAGMAPQWVKFPVPSYRLNAQRYFLALFSGGSAGVARMYGDGPNNWYGVPMCYDACEGYPTHIQPSDLQAGTRTLSMYIEYEVKP